MTGDPDRVRRWIDRLDAATRNTLATTRAAPPGRRAIEPVLRAWIDGSSVEHPASGEPDVVLWQSLVLGRPIPRVLLNPPESGPDAPTLADRAGMSLEVWTEADLSALHALWHAAAREPHPERWRTRCFDAARWHVEHLQPDNATQVPWGLHVFVLAACATSDDAERWSLDMHAQTLLHNAIVSSGAATGLSALVLVDAARALLAELESGGADGQSGRVSPRSPRLPGR